MTGGAPGFGVVVCASCAYGDVRDVPGRGDRIAPAPASRPVVLLTGFGPFPGVPRNASADLFTELAATHPDHFPGFTLAAAVLPVDWTDAPRRLAEVLIATAPAIAVQDLFEQRTWKLSAINAGYNTVAFTLIGAIIGAFN